MKWRGTAVHSLKIQWRGAEGSMFNDKGDLEQQSATVNNSANSARLFAISRSAPSALKAALEN